MKEILTELARANKKFPNFHSPHEGYAVMIEEMDELWQEIKAVKYPVTSDEKQRMHRECVQIAAMAIKFINSIKDY